MPEYRLYTIKKGGHIAGPPAGVMAADDRAAIAVATSASIVTTLKCGRARGLSPISFRMRQTDASLDTRRDRNPQSAC